MGEKSELCKTCAAFKAFGDKCWYYWDYKSACTQHKKHDLDEPGYSELKE